MSSSHTPTVSNATTTITTMFTGRERKLSRIARRGRIASSGTVPAWAANKVKTPETDTNNNKERASVSQAQLARSARWSALRREILPTPALVAVSAKIQHIIKLLKQPPEDRSESDVKILYQWLMNQDKLSSLFTTMSDVSAKKLCKEMEFLCLKSGDIVVNQGDKGSTCFILLSGLVSVYVRDPNDQINIQRSVSLATRQHPTSTTSTYGTHVVTLTSGATFGELCLIEPDSKRSATVIVDQQAQVATFIVLTASSYLRMTRSQTIEGTITDNIAFLQHLLIFKNWSKMQIMHIVNSMKLVNVSAGQFLTRKGAEADSFYVFLRGEAVESVNLTVNDRSRMSMGEARSVQQSIRVELTFLGKFDVAGEYLASEKKVLTCPVDIRATTDIDCLVLTRNLFMIHFGGKELKPHVASTRRRLRSIAAAREAWRETRILQALQYPNLHVPITRKLMRLSGNFCLICGRCTHVAGDQLCMELPLYYMLDEKQKKREKKEQDRTASNTRVILAPQSLPNDEHSNGPSRSASIPGHTDLPSLITHDRDNGYNLQSPGRLGRQLVTRQWQETEKNRAVYRPQRPMTTPSRDRSMPVTITSIPRSSYNLHRPAAEQQCRLVVAKDKNGKARTIQEELQHIRNTWPHSRDNDDTQQQQDATTGIRRRLRSPPVEKERQSGSLSART